MRDASARGDPQSDATGRQIKAVVNCVARQLALRSSHASFNFARPCRRSVLVLGCSVYGCEQLENAWVDDLPAATDEVEIMMQGIDSVRPLVQPVGG